MSVRVHPKVTTAQLHALLERFRLVCHHDWTRGRLRVFLEVPGESPRRPFQYFCEACPWSGDEPVWALVEIPDPLQSLAMEAARCPICRSFQVASRINS